MSIQLGVGPHSSASLIRTNSAFTVDNITTNGLSIGTTFVSIGDIGTSGVYQIDGQNIFDDKNTLSSGVTSSSIEELGTLTTLNISGDLNVDTTTLVVDSTNNNVGINTNPNSAYSLHVSGNTNIEGGVTIVGDLNVVGGTTSTFTTIATVEENFLKLAISNTADLIDSGVYHGYVVGTTKYAGYFRDASDGVFKFFKDTEVEPSSTIDLGATGFDFADIFANDLSSNTLNISTTAVAQDISITNDLSVGNNLNVTNQISAINNIGTSGVYQIDEQNIFDDKNTLSNGVTTSNLQTVGTLNSLDISGDLTVDTNTLHVNSISDRVGIKNTAPTYDLDVSGEINTTNLYRVAGVEVLSNDTLGSGIVNSSLTNVGTLSDLTVSGDLTVDTNTLYVDSTNNNVGIGTTSPDEPLHIVEDNAVSGIQMKVENTNTSGRAGIQLDNGGTNVFNIQQNINDAILENFAGSINYLAAASGRHNFFTTNTNELRMAIENNGNVGIGTTSTAAFTLDVNNEINASSGYYLDGSKIIDGTGITVPTNIHFNDTTKIINSSNNIDIQVTGVNHFRFNTNGNFVVNSGNIGIGAEPSIDLAIGATNTGLNQASGNELAIYTDGSERIRIDANGLVGIQNDNPLYSLDVFGDINFTGQFFQNGSPFVVSDGIWVQNNGDAYNTQLGKIGIGITTPSTKLHINSEIIDDNNYSYDEDALMVVHQTPTTTTTLNDPQEVLYLGRQGTGAQAYGAASSFALSRYENAGSFNVGSRTRLDLNLTNDTFNFVTNTTWLSNGNVGIGTTAPSSLLNIEDTNSSIRFGDTSFTNVKTFIKSDTHAPIIGVQYNGNSIWGIQALDTSNRLIIGALSGNDLTNNIVVSPVGVGIGTTANEALTVDGNIEILDFNDILFRRTDGTQAATISSNNEGLTISENRGAIATSFTVGSNDTQVTNNSDLNQFIITTESGTLLRRANAQFRSTFGTGVDTVRRRSADIVSGFESGQTWGGEYLAFHVGNNGSQNDSGVLTSEKMRISADGDVYINGAIGINTLNPTIDLAIGDNDTGFNQISDGVLSQYTNGTETIRLTTDRTFNIYGPSSAITGGLNIRKQHSSTTNNIFQLFFRDASNPTNGFYDGDIRTDGAGNLIFQNASDRRLKENIIDYSGDKAIKKLKSLNVKEYEWIDKKEIGRVVGFIAQDVKEVLPKSVGTFTQNGEEYYGISQTEMIPFLWGGLKKVIEDKEKLEQENIELKTQINNILNRLDILENK